MFHDKERKVEKVQVFYSNRFNELSKINLARNVLRHLSLSRNIWCISPYIEVFSYAYGTLTRVYNMVPKKDKILQK